MNVLLIEDEENIAKPLCKMLENPSGLSAKELFGYVHLEKFPVEPFGFEEKSAVVLFDYRHRDMRGNSEYILVAQYSNNDVEIFNENLYNEFIKDLK